MSRIHQQFLLMPFRALEDCDHQWDLHSHVASPIKSSNTLLSLYIKQEIKEYHGGVMSGITGCPGIWCLSASIILFLAHFGKSEILLWLCINHSKLWEEKPTEWDSHRDVPEPQWVVYEVGGQRGDAGKRYFARPVLDNVSPGEK